MNDHKTQAADILREAIVIDGMGGSIVHPTPYVAEGTYEEKLVGFGWTGMNSTLVSEPSYTPTYEEVLKAVNENLLYFEMSPKARFVETATDIETAKINGQFAVILGLQSPSFIDQDRSRVRIMHKLGLRILQMTYMERNFLGDGCLEFEQGSDALRSADRARLQPTRYRSRLRECRHPDDDRHCTPFLTAHSHIAYGGTRARGQPEIRERRSDKGGR